MNMAVFEAERQRLWGLAYRICGRRSDADDVLQEAWLRWQRHDGELTNPAAWLTTVVGRLSIDALRRRQRVTYVGPWLPDPLDRPVPDHGELVDSLTVSFLALLERLDPIERVVFLLADVFDEPYASIALTVDRSEVACRQIASRARRRVRDPRRQRTVDRDAQWRLASAFMAAATAGDLDALASLLDDDVTLVSDGGPDVRAARLPVVGAARVARFVSNLSRRVPDGADVRLTELNGEPGVVVTSGGRPVLALVVHAGERVEEVFLWRNPEKLAALSRT